MSRSSWLVREEGAFTHFRKHAAEDGQGGGGLLVESSKRRSR